MATAGVPLWSTTAASNATADPAANWPEGMAPSAVNDAARGMMASVAKWRDDLYGLTTGGTSTAFTVTTGSTFASDSDMSGIVFCIIPHTDSGASPTLSVDGLTGRAINEATGVAIPESALKSGTPYLVKYVHATTEFIFLGRSSVFNALETKGVLTQSSTSHGVLATGTTAQRPSATAGGFRFNSTTGVPEFSDGASWLSLLYTLSGAQTPYGAVINGTIAESHTGNAVTYSLKTLAGNDPSAGDPVVVAFRNATSGTGNYVYRTITSALSLTLSSGSTLGTSSGSAFNIWLVLFDDDGTIRMGAISCWNGSSIYPLGQSPIASSTAEGGLGAADSAHVFYTGSAVASKAYAILGYAAYDSGLASAGAWDSAPTRIQLFGSGVPLPGNVIRKAFTSSTDTTTPTDATPVTTGVTISITPAGGANIFSVVGSGYSTNQWSSHTCGSQLYRGSTALGVRVDYGVAASSGPNTGGHAMSALDAPGTSSSVTYSIKVSRTAGAGTPTWSAGMMTIEELQG